MHVGTFVICLRLPEFIFHFRRKKALGNKNVLIEWWDWQNWLDFVQVCIANEWLLMKRSKLAFLYW